MEKIVLLIWVLAEYLMPLSAISLNYNKNGNTLGEVLHSNLKIDNKNQNESLSNDNIFYEDNYIEQKIMKQEEKEEYERLENIGMAPSKEKIENNINRILSSNNVFTDHENYDGKSNTATVIEASGEINAKLDLKDGWTQFWNAIGRKDEDYYIFSLKEQLIMSFEFSAPSGYFMRILKYGSEDFVISSVSGIFKIELVPAS